MQHLIKRIEEKTGMYKKYLTLKNIKTHFNEDEVNIISKTNTLHKDITEHSFIERIFEIRCKMNFEDSIIELDFEFAHGQTVTLHFVKNCKNDIIKKSKVLIENPQKIHKTQNF